MERDSSPFYQKLSLNLISICLIGLIVIYGSSIIIPLALAILFATMLLPVVRWLNRKGLKNKPLSILIPLVTSIVIVGAVMFLLSTQIANFVEDVPTLSEKGDKVIGNFQSWIDENAHVGVQKQNQYFRQGVDNLKQQAPKLVGATFVSIAGMVTYLVLIPILTFLTLYYRTTIKDFLVGVFNTGSTTKVNEVLEQSTNVAQQYVTGLLIETVIVFTLNTIGFLIIGIEYAIFLALLAAILNLVPYVGILVANVLCMAVTLLTSDNIADVVWVGVVLGVVQLFDNNFGMPMIVGNKVRINALVTIIGVLIGGALCGIPGMFLAIPTIAVAKIIFDKVPELKPWGTLLGDDSKEPATAGATSGRLRKRRVKNEKEELVNQ